jgi:hypothetical protein
MLILSHSRRLLRLLCDFLRSCLRSTRTPLASPFGKGGVRGIFALSQQNPPALRAAPFTKGG